MILPHLVHFSVACKIVAADSHRALFKYSYTFSISSSVPVGATAATTEAIKAATTAAAPNITGSATTTSCRCCSYNAVWHDSY
jgi:hypothetical protein